MIKTFKSTDRITLSKSFCSKEFYCKCGKFHDNLISDELVNKLQNLIEVVGADKAVITSGYRCPTHSINVGGSATDYHTKGYAADVKFYKGNTELCTKMIACKAQDLGFTGIANIDSTYTAIHLDVRSGSKWYGDEVVTSTSSVCTDFYAYYGFARNENNSIRELQSILNKKGARLAVDGIAGKQTIAEVRKYTIDEGDSGELTKWVQTKLKSLGHVVGEIDGIAGEKTMNAIAEWQIINNLGVGYFGGGDWNILLK